MAKYNASAFGQKIFVNFSQDISSASSLKMILQPECGPSIEKSASFGVTDLYLDDQRLLAKQYIESPLLAGDLSYVGRWRVKGEATLAGQKIVTDYALFRVMP